MRKTKHMYGGGIQPRARRGCLVVRCCCAKRVKALIATMTVIFCSIYFIILTPTTQDNEILYVQNGRFRRFIFQDGGQDGGQNGSISRSLNRDTTNQTKPRLGNETVLTKVHQDTHSELISTPNKVITTFLNKINVSNIPFNRTAFGQTYRLNATRSNLFDFSFIIDGKDICGNKSDPFLVIMVLSVHTHVDTRAAIRKTWGRAATPGVWPKIGDLKHNVKLIFLFGKPKTELGNKIVNAESKIYGDIVQADFVDSYFNLTYKTVTGIRWVAEFCPRAQYILKADEDVFVHVYNLLQFLSKREEKRNGAIYGHALYNSDVFREGRWAVTKSAFPLNVYPTYTCGNTYVISGNMAAHIYYTAGLLPYLNIEDVFVTGIVRTFLSAELNDVLGFTHWFEKKPKPCEFKNSVRISATKVADFMQYEIWEGLKNSEADCFRIIRTRHVKANRPERGPRMVKMIRDEHIFMNKTNGQFYVL